MRAVCEACGRPQPPDWKAGDLCAHCGKAVRAEARCFWCAKWTPQAKFCRACGAEVVPPPQYGAARMLKDAGADRFTVPKMLRELDPEQVENFSRIYQRHAVAVARHVDELRFLERFLCQKTFSVALEDELVPQLPWPEEALARYSGPPLPAGDDLATARAIEAATPVFRTRALAAVARVRLDDWGAVDAALDAFVSGDPAVRTEAALALTGWRVRTAVGPPREEGDLLRALDGAPFPLEAAVRRALAGESDPSLLRDALASPDGETAFAAALALGDVDRLRNALRGGDLERIAAGRRLAGLGDLAPLEAPLRSAAPGVQLAILDALLGREGPATELSDALLRLAETSPDGTLRERAVRLLRRRLPPEWALRIARAAKGERNIFQSLLSVEAALPTEAAAGVAEFMLQSAPDDNDTAVAAAQKLVELGVLPPLDAPLREAAPDVQFEILAALLGREGPAAELSAALLHVAETSPDGTLRERAVRLLRRRLPPEWALRIARAAQGERYIFQSLLSEEAALPPEAAAEVAAFMVENGLFTMNQYGLAEAGKRGAIPDTFVPAQFEGADPETRRQLLRFAEEQLGERGDEALHRFVLNVVFGPYDAETRAAAWWSLSRWYKRGDVASHGPLALRADALERFFGSARAFVPKLAAVMSDPATLKEVGVYDDLLARLFKDADPAVVPALAEDAAAGRELVRALLDALAGDYWFYLRTGIAEFLGRIGAHPAWRGDVVAGLERLRRHPNYDMVYACERALKRIAGEEEA